MFSGIIEKTGKVLTSQAQPGGLEISLETGFSDLALGESVAVNGACLTVTRTEGTQAWFFLSQETLSRTALAQSLELGARANLERALRVDSRLSGHIVQGHVDGVGYLDEIQADGDCHRLRFKIPSEVSRYCVEKGSITLQGISLTLNQVSEPKANPAWVEVMIIPHTWKETQLGDLRPGDPVNVEADILAKHVERLWLSR